MTTEERWSDEDEAEWQRLNAIPILQRDRNERSAYVALQARRELAIKIYETEMAIERDRQKRALERSGALYKIGVLLAIAGFGSCAIGACGGGGDLIVLGIVLVVVAGGLNGLNKWLLGIKD